MTIVDGDSREHGLCADADPDVFYDHGGLSAEPAKAICRRCPVQPECLEYALAHDERFGIWGGMTAKERGRLRQERGLPTRAERDRAEKQATVRRMRAAGRTKAEIGRLLGLSGSAVNAYLATAAVPVGIEQEGSQR